MAPLQRAVYWRLCLIFFFTAFLFFLDVFTINRSSCIHSDPINTTDISGDFPHDTDVVNKSFYQAQLPLWSNTAQENGTVCEELELLSYGQTMYMTGLLLGSLFGGALSDRCGKRVVLLVCVCLHAFCGLIPAVLPQPILFLALRCLTGVVCCCINICSFSLGVEWSLPRYRIWPPALLSFFFSLGMMALAPVAYLSQTLRQLHMALGIPQLLCLPLYLSIPESPCWLLLKKRTATLEEYRNSSAEDRQCLDQLLDNKLRESKKDGEIKGETHTSEADTNKPEEINLSDFAHLRSPTILLRLAIMSYIGFASALTYYGICLNVGSFGVDVYLAQFFSGLSEAPCLLVPFLLARCGRRPISMLTLLLSGSACILSLLVSRFCELPAVGMALALLGKFCVLTTVFVSMLYSIELFPTVIRQKCVGLVNLCYRVGCILNTMVSAAGGIPLAAMVVYGSGPIIGSGLCLLLPETSGVPLPDSVKDCERQPTLSLQPPTILCCTGNSMDIPVDNTAPFLEEKGSKGPLKLPGALATEPHAHISDRHAPRTNTGVV